MLYPILLIIFSIIYGFTDGIHDFHLDAGNKETWHILDWCIKSWVYLFIGVTGFLKPDFQWSNIIKYGIIAVTFYWITHDFTTGYLYGGSIWYLGKFPIDNWGMFNWWIKIVFVIATLNAIYDLIITKR